MIDFLELSLKRESCRSYTGEAVSEDMLKKIVEAGRLSPSACNSQPWHFYVVSCAETIAGVKRALKTMGAKKFTDEAGAFILISGAKESYTERVGEAIYGRDFSNMDIGITVANMSLAATMLGLGTCIIGAFSESKVKDAAGISASSKDPLKLLLAIGKPTSDVPREKIRKTFEEIATFI